MSRAKTNQREDIKLLIVEDDRTYRILAAKSLQGIENYRIEKIVADTARNGLTTFRQANPDITLLDIQLPDGSGLDLLKACLHYNPHAFIVMITSSASAEDVRRAQQAGASGYILKPFNMRKIQDIMDVYEVHRAQSRPEANGASGEKKEINIDDLFEKPKEESQEMSLEDVIAEWNILFVDDYLTNCDNAKRYLSKMKNSVEVATTAEEALKKIKKKHFQLMFFDTELPDMTGYHLAMKVREQDRNEPVKSYLVAMMKDSAEPKENKWLQVGMNDYLIKPCTFSSLEKMLLKYAKQYKDDLKETFFS